MLFRLRGDDGDSFLSGTWIGAEGKAQPLQREDVVIKPLKLAMIAGRNIPVQWSLAVLSQSLNVTVVPLNPNSWMATSIEYWEGPVTAEGSHTGTGYLEMTGY